jgi:hypothetical protein
MEALYDALFNLLIVLINVGVGYLILFLRKKKIFSELKHFDGLVEVAVKSVQQGFGDLENKEKFNTAKDWLITVAKERGIKISESQIDFLIESVLKDLKSQFYNEWKETKDTDK